MRHISTSEQYKHLIKNAHKRITAMGASLLLILLALPVQVLAETPPHFANPVRLTRTAPYDPYISAQSLAPQVVDINQDSLPDLVSLDFKTSYSLMGYITARLSNGDGTFGATITSPVSWTRTLQIFDATGDSKPDAVTISATDATNNSDTGMLQVRPGNGDGTFGAVTQTLVTPGRIAIAGFFVSDVNSDGSLDVLASFPQNIGQSGSVNAPIVITYLNNGSGMFTASTPVLISDNRPYILRGVADLTGDSKPDILTGNNAGQGSIWRGDGTGNFTDTGVLITGSSLDSNWATPTIADFTNDNLPDIAIYYRSVYSNDYQTAIGVYVNLGEGNFSTYATRITSPRISETISTGLKSADINHDNKTDLVAWNNGAGVDVYLGDGAGHFSAAQSLSIPLTYQVTTGDISQDGNPEIIVGASGNLGSIDVSPALLLNLNPPLDTVAPSVLGEKERTPDYNGWYNNDVTVTWSSTDPAPSSGTPTTPPLTLANLEGEHTYTSEPSCDPANNCATGTVTIKLDKTAPTLGTLSWSNNPKAIADTTTLSVPASDSTSGIAGAEYFIGDADPGVGNGATMSVDTNTISTNFGTDFPTGVYKITTRAQDNAGNWSAPASDYLVVFNPTGPRMTGRHSIVPSLAGGDILPGLVQATQSDDATFAFSVKYDGTGQIDTNSDMQLTYKTGTNCNNPSKAQNCHTLDLNTTAISWLTTQGTNDATGIFQGTANLAVDGVVSQVVFRVTAVDGDKMGNTPDQFQIKIYTLGADLNTATPLYQINTASIEHGNINIQ